MAQLFSRKPIAKSALIVNPDARSRGIGEVFIAFGDEWY
jgi:hypothetical protein